MKQIKLLLLVLVVFSCGKKGNVVVPTPEIETKLIKLATSSLVHVEDISTGGRTPQDDDTYLVIRTYLNGSHYRQGIVDHRGIDTLSLEIISVQPQAQYEIVVDAIRKGTAGGPFMTSDRMFGLSSYPITNEMVDDEMITFASYSLWNNRYVYTVDSAETRATEPSEIDVFVGTTTFLYDDIVNGETITIDANRMSNAIELVAYNLNEGELLYEVSEDFDNPLMGTLVSGSDSAFHVFTADRTDGSRNLDTRLSRILNGDTSILFQDNLVYTGGNIKRFEVNMEGQSESKVNPLSINILDLPLIPGDTIVIN